MATSRFIAGVVLSGRRALRFALVISSAIRPACQLNCARNPHPVPDSRVSSAHLAWGGRSQLDFPATSSSPLASSLRNIPQSTARSTSQARAKPQRIRVPALAQSRSAFASHPESRGTKFKRHRCRCLLKCAPLRKPYLITARTAASRRREPSVPWELPSSPRQWGLPESSGCSLPDRCWCTWH